MSKLTRRITNPFAFRSLAFRLTIWYAGVFLIIAVLLFGGLYFLLYSLILKQTDEALAVKSHNVAVVMSRQGRLSLQEQIFIDNVSTNGLTNFSRLLNEDGEEYYSSNPGITGIDLTQTELTRLLATGQPFFKTVRMTSFNFPVRVGFFYLGPNTILQVSQSLESSYQLLDLFRLIFLLGLTGAFILTVLLSAVLAGNLLKMINNVTQTAAEIADASHPQLDRRVYVGNENNEISEMARTFNTMLERIQNLVAGMEEMSDNMAHDLKSPVTRIRGLTEVTLMHGASVDEYEKMGADIINECDTLLGMINNILFISKAKHGVYVPQMTEINLNALVEQAYQMFLPLAESKDLYISCTSTTSQPMFILADKKLLQRALANLIDNAIKYTNSGGVVDLVCMRENGYAVLKVCDTGNGIPLEDLDRIFERFYRSDVSRSSEGTGLGLSFVKAAIEAMYGTITVESVLGQNSCFTVTFEIFNKLEAESGSRDLLSKLVQNIADEGGR